MQDLKERNARTLQRFRDFWLNKSTDTIVSIYSPLVYRQIADEEEMVKKACECITKDIESGEQDILPIFVPDFGTITTAAMWGGEIIPATADSCIHIHPAIEKIQDFDKLTVCDFEQSDYRKAIRLYRKVCERLGTDEIFVRTPDFQGPMNTLALIMDQTELLCALFEEPDLVHRALNAITDVLIDYVSRYCDEIGREKVVGSIWPYICIPSDMGMSLTQDYMPLLSPELYKEFEIPCLKRIADHFGGVFIHCCGEYSFHLDTLKNADFKIWGLESAYPETPVWNVHQVFGDDIVYLVGVSPTGAREFPTVIDYAKRIAETDCKTARFWYCSTPDWVDTEALKRQLNRA